MKKWETALLIAFFMVFAILFFAVVDFQWLWLTKPSKIGEIIHIGDVSIEFEQLSVDDSLTFWFSINESYKPLYGVNYEAGEGGKFILLHIFIVNSGKENITFRPECMEDIFGAVYYDYKPGIEATMRCRPYYITVPPGYILRYPYGGYVKLAPGEGEHIAIVYRLPLNAAPEKFHYEVSSSKWYHFGEVILKK